MSWLFACSVLLILGADDADRRPHVEKYLRRCADAKRAALANARAELDRLNAKNTQHRVAREKLVEAQAALREIEQTTLLLPMPMPPRQNEVGRIPAIATAAHRQANGPDAVDVDVGRVDVLEIIDGDNAIVRAWYLPTNHPPRERTDASEPTFADIWLRGVDTGDMKVGRPLAVAQVFFAAGNQTFGTTCGQRSLPLLEAIDIDAFRPPTD